MPQGTPNKAAIDRRLRKTAGKGLGDYNDATDRAMVKGKADSAFDKDQSQTSELISRLKHIRTGKPGSNATLPTAGFKKKSRSVASGFNPSTANRARSSSRFGSKNGRF